MRPSFTSSAPGRLCLFGEHQDYLGLPVIAMAVNRRCRLHFNPVMGQQVRVTSAVFGDVGAIDVDGLNKGGRKDPLFHALAALRSEFGNRTMEGWHIHIESEIPVRAGCSSSTALMTAWIAGWLEILQGQFDADDVVSRCHRYEVLDFDGAGGNMDQFACGHGGLRRFGAGAPQTLRRPEGVFILGDSGEPKDTQGHLRRCRDARIPLMPFIDQEDPPVDGDRWTLLEGTRINRDLEARWGAVMRTETGDGVAFGADLTRHHGVLRDVLGLSTPRIEGMLDAARGAGAWGGKINGSGGGGCCFALCPEDVADDVIEGMLSAGAAGAWRVEMDEGVGCSH